MDKEEVEMCIDGEEFYESGFPYKTHTYSTVLETNPFWSAEEATCIDRT